MKKCIGFCVADEINLNALVQEYPGEIKKLRESLKIEIDDSEFYIFPFGVFVYWGNENYNFTKFREIIDPYCINIFTKPDYFMDEFEVSRVESKYRVHEDTIYLEEEDEYIRLSYSHAIAQSLKLSQIEDEILKPIKEMSHIPQQLASQGKISKSKTEIAKLRGKLYLLKSKVNLNYALLDKPEFFWEWPEYDEYYQKMYVYLELEQRVGILTKRLSVIDELLSILADELNHRHSSTLEWIIIWLILIEIIIFIGHDWLKLF